MVWIVLRGLPIPSLGLLDSIPKGLADEWLVFAFYVAAVAVWELLLTNPMKSEILSQTGGSCSLTRKIVQHGPDKTI